MSTTILGEAVVRFGAETSGLTAGINTAKGALTGLADMGPVGAVTAGIIGLGIAAVGVGAVTAKMAGDFQQGMNLLVTSAGESQKNIKMVSDGILQMSVDTATSTTKLSAAMFIVSSSSYHGAAGLAILQAAAEGAKVENADLTGVVQALTTTMHDWHEPASQAVDVMNSFREAASLGNMRMDDFTGAMKNVGPVASLAGIKISDVEAALSTMSLEGDKGASAGTHLAQSLLNMIAPSSKAQGVLKEIGLTAQQVSDGMKKSLPDTLALITDDIGKKFPVGSEKYNAALSAMFGGTRGLKAILELTSGNLKDFQKDAAAIAPTMKANSTAVDGWTTVQGNFNFKMDAAKASVEAVGIKIGTLLLPVLGHIVEKVAPVITAVGNWLVPALEKAGQTISQVVGNISSIVAQVNWRPIFQTAGAAAHQFGDDIASVGSFIANIDWGGVFNTLLDAGKQVSDFLIATFTPVWTQLVDTWQNQVAPAVSNLVSAFQALAPTLLPIAEGLGVVIVGAAVILATVVAQTAKVVIGAFGGVIQFFSGFVQGMLGYVALFNDLWSGNWGRISTDFQAIWSGIVDIVKGALNFINGITGGALSNLVSLFGGNFSKMTASTGNMTTNVKSDFTDMKNSSVQTMSDMQKQTIEKGAGISTGVQNLFDVLKQQSSDSFGQMSQDAYSYLQSVEQYVSDAQAQIIAHQIGRNSSNIINKNFNGYAEGGDVPQTGVYTVGERGPEQVVLQGGSHVYPHGTSPSTNVYPSTMAIAPSQGNNGRQEIHLNLKLQIDGQELSYTMVDHLGQAIVDRIRAEGPVAA